MSTKKVNQFKRQIYKLVLDKDIKLTETGLRRIERYQYEDHTVITHTEKSIEVNTDILHGIKNRMIIHLNGHADIDFDFGH